MDEEEVVDKEGVTASHINSWENARSTGKENAISDMNLCWGEFYFFPVS